MFLQALLKLQDENFRIILADSDADSIEIVLCLAYQANMTAKDNYVWLLPDWVTKSWLHRKSMDKMNKPLPCPEEHIDAALEGHFALSQQFYGSDDSTIYGNPNITVEQWKSTISKDLQLTNLFAAPSYLGFVYDAVFLYAHALRRCITDDQQFPLNIKYNQSNTERLARSIEHSTFKGVSGWFRFGKNASRITNKEMLQWINGSWRKVFLFNNEDMTVPFKVGPDVIHWANGKVPLDGSPDVFMTRLVFILCSLLVIFGVAVITFLYSMRRYSSKLSRAYEVKIFV